MTVHHLWCKIKTTDSTNCFFLYTLKQNFMLIFDVLLFLCIIFVASLLMVIISLDVKRIQYVCYCKNAIFKKCSFTNCLPLFCSKKSLVCCNNSYLSHRIIDSFPWLSKFKILRLKLVLLAPMVLRLGLTKLGLN